MTECNNLLEVIGGLSLILYGIHLSGINLQKILGSYLEIALKKSSGNPIKGVGIGAGITSMIHSSGTTTVMLIGLITGGFISLTDAVPVILGANIGSTIATQLASMRIGNYALLFLIAGVVTHILSEKKINKRIGEALIGFSFLFLGMDFVFRGMEGLAQDEIFAKIIASLTGSPVRAFTAGAILTVLLRSSSAISILAVALGAVGAIGLPAALYLVLGINLGTSLKVLRIALAGKNFSGKLALIHLIMNVFGVGIFIILFPYFQNMSSGSATEAGRQIANAHTLYNIITAIVFLPLAPLLIYFVNKISPAGRTLKKNEFFYLDKKLICTPSVSLEQVNRGVVAMAKTAYDMLEASREIYFENKPENFIRIEQQENKIDNMTERISEYTIQVSQQNLSKEDAMRLYSIMHIVADIEHLCDHIFDVSKIFIKMKDRNEIKFSAKAQTELTAVYGKLRIMQNLIIKSLDENNVKLANEVTEHENKVDEIIKKININHQSRLKNEECDQQAAGYFTDILYHLERIGDHYDNVAYAIIDRFRREERK